MKTKVEHQVRLHALLQDVGENDHHNRGESFSVNINALSVPSGTSEVRIDVGKTGFRTVRCFAMGKDFHVTGGYDGCYFYGTTVAAESCAKSIKKGTSTYIYIGAFSRMHGDSYISDGAVFGSNLYMVSVHVDGSDVVFTVYNNTGSNKTFTMRATGVVK